MFGVIPIDVYLMVEHKYWDTLIKEKKKFAKANVRVEPGKI